MKKIFDCVEMKRKAQEIIYEEIKNMSIGEELKYWQEREKRFLEDMNNIKHPSLQTSDSI